MTAGTFGPPFTFPPCPWWCQTDHTDEIADVVDLRTHEYTVYSEPGPDGQPAIWVDVARCDVAIDVDDEAAGRIGELLVSFNAHDENLTAAQARLFAAAIVEGAGLVEQWSRR